MKKTLAMILCLVLCAALFAGCGSTAEAPAAAPSDATEASAEKSITLRVAENQPAESHLAKCMLKFADLVGEKSNGAMKVEVYLNGELGDEAEVIEQVDAGVLDIARVDASALTPYVSELETFSLPYIFDNDEHKWNVFNGTVGQKISDKLEEEGFVNLGFLESGWRSFYSKNEIKGVDDLKGLKIRVQDSQVYIKMMELFGANATPMPFAEVFTSLQTGVIDAAENDPVSYVSNGHYEVAKYFLEDRHSADINLFVMSKAIFDSLSEEQQKIIMDSAKEAVDYEIELALGLQEEAKETAQAAGCTFIETDIGSFQKVVAPIYDMYPQYSEIIAEIRAAA